MQSRSEFSRTISWWFTQKCPSLQFIMLLKKVNFIFVNESGSMFICALTTSPIFKSHHCTIGAEGVLHLPEIASGATKLGTLMECGWSTLFSFQFISHHLLNPCLSFCAAAVRAPLQFSEVVLCYSVQLAFEWNMRFFSTSGGWACLSSPAPASHTRTAL